MDFRFPHPLENIVDAIKAAADPGNPEDGGLAVQLLNENNHALEDQLGEQVLTTVYQSKTGSYLGTYPYFTMTVPLPVGGLWSLSCLMYVDGSTDDSPSPAKVPHVYMDIAGSSFGIASFHNPIQMVSSPADSTFIVQGSCSGSALYNAESPVNITVGSRAGGFRPISWRPGATARVQLWGVRLGPVSPGLD